MSKDKEKEKGAATQVREQPLHELWGAIFMALGVLVLVSLVSHFVNSANNILGPWLGVRLALGLLYLFGPIAVFFFPAAIILGGYQLLRNSIVYHRSFVYGAILTLEICTLLSIHHLPFVHSEQFSLAPNAIGNSLVYSLYWVFGPHRFGPYFLFSFALVLTALLALRLNIAEAFKFVAVMMLKGLRRFIAWLRGKIVSLRERDVARTKKPSEVVAAEPDFLQPPVAPAKPARAKREEPLLAEAASVVAGAALPAEQEILTPEEEAKRQLQKQLAEFRAKKAEPIKISTLQPKPDQPEEDPESVSDVEQALVEAEIKKAASAAEAPAPLAPQEEKAIEHEEFFGVAVEEEKPRSVQKVNKPYQLPPADILPDPPVVSAEIDRDAIEVNSRTLEQTLLNFGIEGKVVNVNPGPVVTRYEIEPAPGTKISKIVSLQNDLAMALGGKKIRIEAPIPGKAAIGVELPNADKQMVFFKHILTSEVFTKAKHKLPIVIGKNISGFPFVTDVTKMPHMLIAGQTGSGKSVCINSIICSLLMTKTPDELRLILVDPKKVELSYYEGASHLMSPVVTEAKEAVRALHWGVHEMERRYRILAKAGARNIESFNTKVAEKTIKEGLLSEQDNKAMPFVVIIVDELADLMVTASRDVETLIQRIAQLARAVGIHLIVATQRPSVNVITGTIKANLTSRMAFRTIQAVDSRTILDQIGAEKLLGNGDMLFLRSNAPDIERFHGAYISEQDVEAIVGYIRNQAYEVERIESFQDVVGDANGGDDGAEESSDDGSLDNKFDEAARLIVSIGQGSTSLLQRRLSLGYARAGRLMDQLHQAGIVGPQQGSKMREVLVQPGEIENLLAHVRRN